MENFIYEPLPTHSKAIRLVSIVGAASDGLVTIRSKNTVLGQDKYIALSHVWGTEYRNFKVLLDGRPFWLRPKLYAFIKYAQRKLPELNIWIDALCIDQDSIDEKNRQISLMGEIFNQAERVLGWLHGAPDAIGLQYDRDPNLWSIQLLTQVTCMDERQPVPPGTERIIAVALLNLLQHEYWSRLWIVQEISLARHVDIVRQGHTIEWNRLKAAITSVLSDPADPLYEPLRSLGGGIQGLPIFDFFDELADLRILNPATDANTYAKSSVDAGPNPIDLEDRSLLSLMLRYSNHACSETYDQVYALMALSDTKPPQTDYADLPISLLARLVQAHGRRTTVDQVREVGHMLGIRHYQHVTFEIVHTARSHISLSLSATDGMNICNQCLPEHSSSYHHLSNQPIHVLRFPRTLFCFAILPVARHSDMSFGTHDSGNGLPLYADIIAEDIEAKRYIVHSGDDGAGAFPWTYDYRIEGGHLSLAFRDWDRLWSIVMLAVSAQWPGSLRPCRVGERGVQLLA